MMLNFTETVSEDDMIESLQKFLASDEDIPEQLTEYALITALSTNKFKVAEWLIDNGVDVKCFNCMPLTIAKNAQNPQLVEKIEKAMNANDKI